MVLSESYTDNNMKSVKKRFTFGVILEDEFVFLFIYAGHVIFISDL